MVRLVVRMRTISYLLSGEGVRDLGQAAVKSAADRVNPNRPVKVAKSLDCDDQLPP